MRGPIGETSRCTGVLFCEDELLPEHLVLQRRHAYEVDDLNHTPFTPSQRLEPTEVADMLDGLQAYYDGPSDRAIGVGDLIHHAKTARRNRVAGEEAAEREARQAELDATKPAPEETVAVAAAFIPGPVRRTPRLEAAEDSLNACVDKASAQAALREYFAAKRESRRLYPPPKPAPRKRRPQPEGANA